VFANKIKESLAVIEENDGEREIAIFRGKEIRKTIPQG